jgi:hypothetical protein
VTTASRAWVRLDLGFDPTREIKAEGTLAEQAKVPAQIHKGFGRWNSVCSAIVCWTLVAA